MVSKYVNCFFNGFTECPKKVNVGAIIGGVFGGIVGIVVACLIAWKVFTTLKDRRDLRAFYEEAAKAEWANVSLYRETYLNPTPLRLNDMFKCQSL